MNQIDNQMLEALQYLDHGRMTAVNPTHPSASIMFSTPSGIEPEIYQHHIDYHRQRLDGSPGYYVSDAKLVVVVHPATDPVVIENTLAKLREAYAEIEVVHPEMNIPKSMRFEVDSMSLALDEATIVRLGKHWETMWPKKIPRGERVPHMQRAGFNPRDKKNRRY